MRVQARSEEWPSNRSELIREAGAGQALITGASGEIGGAIALVLAKAGWRLLLQDRGSEPRRERLKEMIDATGAQARFVAADLSKPDQLETVLKAVGAAEDLDLVVHAASPDVTAAVADLVAVNFSAFQRISDVAVPKLLSRQRGSIVFIGTMAVRAAPPGWESYSGAKAMTMNLVDAIDRRFAPYGVRSYTLAPGFVATRFSEPYRSKWDAALLPAEVAEALIGLIEDRDRPGNTMLLEPGRALRGQFGFQAGASEREPASADETIPSAPIAPPTPEPSQARDEIAPLVRSVLKLAATQAMMGGGLGLTPGWDSLKHIEIILSIEAHCGVHFKSSEIEATHRYDDLVALCARKMQAGKTR
jgi:NAD(P)-dependent dehydrogenase (short-subunit alcohol dehydrogenase family)